MADFLDSLKDGLKSFGKTVSETAEVVMQKTEETVEVQKLKAKACSLERDNHKDFQTIGKLLYEQFEKEGSVDETFKALCEEIQGRKELIAEYQSQVAELKGLDICPKCEEHVEVGATFCSKCGAKLSDEAEFEE